MTAIEVNAAGSPATAEDILTDDALEFAAHLHRTFNGRRLTLLRERELRQAEFDSGALPGFESDSEARTGTWQVTGAPADLADRRVEITGPTDRKMVVNALNSGAKVFMADFEDANSPTWHNMVDGQANLRDAVRRAIDFTAPNGKEYRLGSSPATLLVRPRGWHLDEKHLLVDGEPVSGSLFDFGLYFFHNAAELRARDTGPYFYLPKLESAAEARLWNDVFVEAQSALEIPHGTVRATVLIETILAAFEMEEILFELREHSAGLNAGRWDYIFSIIKKFRNREDKVLPDRGLVTMTVPFMKAYAELLIATCHRRGAHAIGGMAAFIPNRRDAAVTEVALANVRADKQRESANGHDGTWVAHPDLVGLASEVFGDVLGDRPNQLDRMRDDVSVAAGELLETSIPDGQVTRDGVRLNIDVAIQYIASWLRGTGAAAIYNLMEDAATAEISRSQVWQWIRHGVETAEGDVVTSEFVRGVADAELARMQRDVGDQTFSEGRYEEARRLFDEVALGEDFPEFLTIPAYDLID